MMLKASIPAQQSGFVIPPERVDNTSSVREAGILAAWVCGRHACRANF